MEPESSNENSPASRRKSAARPAWQLPAGVSRGTWDYATEPSIATQYDTFHQGHPLLDIDRELILAYLGDQAVRENGEPKIAIDLGCGTGRNLLPLAQRGWRTIGVDLSRDMLQQLCEKRDTCSFAPEQMGLVHANMVQLECFQNEIVDAALCMYSSLGMVQGRTNRRRVLTHMCRLLRPDGFVFVHVHNRGSWLRDPGGLVRSIRDWGRARIDRNWEFGDRIYPYRGLPTMFLHVYSRAELAQDLRAAGLVPVEIVCLNRRSSDRLRGKWLCHIRAGGFIAVAKRSSRA